jgi:hypothetical protein
MNERKRKPADTEYLRVCMCVGRGMEHHNLQWEDIFWLRWKVREKEVKPDFAEFLSLYSWSCRSWLLMALLIMWELNISLDILFTHTSEGYKPSSIWLQHFSSNSFQSHDPSLSDAPHPKPCDICVSSSSIFTLKIQIVIPWCSDIQHMKWVNTESQTYTLSTGCESLWISICKCSWIT